MGRGGKGGGGGGGGGKWSESKNIPKVVDRMRDEKKGRIQG